MNFSTPTLDEFEPVIPYQRRVINDIFCNFDYSTGLHEILLSGSVGSAKSILMAHIAVVHLLTFEKAMAILCRKAMPDLKDTILRKVLDHILCLKEGEDYDHHEATGRITFSNGSEVLCRSWADKRYRKLRSIEASCAIVEELTENDSEEFESFYKELKPRVGRLPHIKQNFIICATNPDSPSHSAYNYFINTTEKNRHVYYSITTENPFLPKHYIDSLLSTYTKQEARRMIYGEWIEIKTEVIYYAFNESTNVLRDYAPDKSYPLIISYDFNIGFNKPMSVSLMQYINGIFYIFDEVIIYGARTLDTLDEMMERNLILPFKKIIIHGDATGKSKSTKYNKSDYDIINEYLANLQNYNDFEFEIDVPASNPQVRKRHLIVNGLFCNANEEVKIFITKNCETTIKGFRLSKLKKGGQYIEDDSDYFQHITTAVGYGILKQLDNNNNINRLNQGSIHASKDTKRENDTRRGLPSKYYSRD